MPTDRSGGGHFFVARIMLTVNNTIAYEAACLAGIGLIQAPELCVREHLEAGRLVEVLPEHRPAPLQVTLIYAHRRHVARRVQAFMDWLAEAVVRVTAPNR